MSAIVSFFVSVAIYLSASWLAKGIQLDWAFCMMFVAGALASIVSSLIRDSQSAS